NYSVSKLGIGLIVGLLALTLATIISNVIPLHPFALMILMIAILKLTNTLPKVLVDAAVAWFRFVLKNWTYSLLVGFVITFTDLYVIIGAFTLDFFVIFGISLFSCKFIFTFFRSFICLFLINFS